MSAILKLRRLDGGIDECASLDDGTRINGTAPPDIVDSCARCGALLARPTESIHGRALAYPLFVWSMDPPWSSDNGGCGRGADSHYPTTGPKGIAAAVEQSGAWDAFSDSLGFMWTTTRALCLGDAHELARLLSVEIVSGFVWSKVDVLDVDRIEQEIVEGMIDDAVQNGSTVPSGFALAGLRMAANAAARALVSRLPLVTTPPAKMGLGQWQRTEHEHLLVCRRGRIGVPHTSSRFRSVIYAPRSAHSAKPEAAWRVIEDVVRSVAGDARGVEFFARAPRPGWGAWGRIDGEAAPVRFAP